MVRIAKQPDPERIEALKERIQDERYLETAIQRIAHKLTEELVSSRSGPEHKHPRQRYPDRGKPPETGAGPSFDAQ
ncbi:MAG: hypothetical protein ACLFRR_08560 [Spirochaetaceae bacterium]